MSSASTNTVCFEGSGDAVFIDKPMPLQTYAQRAMESDLDLSQINMHARTLDEVEDSEVALLLVHRKDEVERGVVPVDKFHAFPPLRDAARAYACVIL